MKTIIIPLMILGIVLFLLIHHGFTHDNKEVFNVIDFKSAFNGTFKSHEGLILVTLLLGSGVLIGNIYGK